MAFDRFNWIGLKRPLSEDERAQQLPTNRSVSDHPSDSFSVYEMNDTYLETCDSNASQIGWGVFGFLLMAPLFFYIAIDAISGIFNTPQEVIDAGTQTFDHILMTCVSAVFLLFCVFPVWMLLQDCFNYRRKPVRFNRKTRMVYAFRHTGPGGVIAIPWDSAFFYLQRQGRNGVSQATPFVIRCLALDGQKIVTNTFSCGRRRVSVYRPGSSQEELVLAAVRENFEYFRRYMEEGPAALPPVMARLPSEVSLSNSLQLWFRGAREATGSGKSFLAGLLSVMVFPLAIMAVFHYIAQLTSREPVWPADVDADSTARDAATAASR